MKVKVEVVDSNPNWINEFNTEKICLYELLGNLVQDIHHIGSTSIPGLAAKPIIDIILEVSNLDGLDKLSSKMNLLGYEAKGEFGIVGRRYFVKGSFDRSHQIHAFQVGDENIKRHIAFRDYIKSHPDVKREYAVLKKKLAIECNNNIDQYCDGKDKFVKFYELKALEWLTNT